MNTRILISTQSIYLGVNCVNCVSEKPNKDSGLWLVGIDWGDEGWALRHDHDGANRGARWRGAKVIRLLALG